MKHEFDRRAATPEDIPFLLALRQTTMNPHLAASGASTSESNHMARVMHRFECAEILEKAGVPVGLLKVSRDGKIWRLIQIQFIPSLQGKGLGTIFLKELIAQACDAGTTLTLNVLKENPAKALYERHGFVVESQDEHSYEMRRVA